MNDPIQDQRITRQDIAPDQSEKNIEILKNNIEILEENIAGYTKKLAEFAKLPRKTRRAGNNIKWKAEGLSLLKKDENSLRQNKAILKILEAQVEIKK